MLTLQLYWQAQCTKIDADDILRRNLGTVARIIRDDDAGSDILTQILLAKMTK